MTRPVHPIADLFPMMTDEELANLAADIKANGLIHPIVVDNDGLLIDGRNRARACEIAGIEPTTVLFEGDDPRAYIIASNIARRHMSKGQQAMAVAMVYPEPEKTTHGKKSKTKLLLETFSSTLTPPGARLFALPMNSREVFQGAIMGLLDRLKAFFRPGAPPPEPRRLDGRSKTLLAASLKMLPEEEPGWITMKEAKTLFSQEGKAYAFGEMDEAGKADLAAFASASGNVQFEFMPVQSRLYFMRKVNR